MCVRACAISVRLPSPRAVTGYMYKNSKIALAVAIWDAGSVCYWMGNVVRNWKLVFSDSPIICDHLKML